MRKEIRIIRRWTLFFIVSLFLSGLTAMPAETELAWLTGWIGDDTSIGFLLHKVYAELAETNSRAPFLAYGYDWLAFAHFMLALLFIGVYKDPVRNKWIIEFGMIACWCVVPFALITGHFRGIPMGWRFIDSMFGVTGLIPLTICYRKVLAMEKEIDDQKKFAI